MTAILFLAQRATAFVLALAVAVHLGTILYAVRGGLTAAEILGRTHGNIAFLLFYGLFVIAVAIHAPIGLRNVLREWTRWRGTFARPRAGAVRDAAARARPARRHRRVRFLMRASHQQRGFVAAMLHRLSGIALAIFLPLHFLALASALNGANALDAFLAVTRQPLVACVGIRHRRRARHSHDAGPARARDRVLRFPREDAGCRCRPASPPCSRSASSSFSIWADAMMAGYPLDTLAVPLARHAASAASRPAARLRLRARRLLDLAAPHRSAAFGPADQRLRHAAAPDHDLAATPSRGDRPAVAVRGRRPCRHSDRRASARSHRCRHPQGRARHIPAGVWQLMRCSSPRLHTITAGGRPPTPASASSAAFSAASAAIPACCRRSGRNCAAGRKQMARAVYQPYIIVIQVGGAGGYRAGDL